MSKILLAVDTVNPPWAFYRIAEQIRKAHGDEFDVEIRQYRDVNRTDNFDIIVSFYWGALLSLYKVQPGACLVCAFYDHFTWKSTGYFQQTIEKADAFTFANPYLKNEILPLLPPNKPHWITEDGVDLDFFKPNGFPDEFTLAWVGNPDIWKNVKRPDMAKEVCTTLNVPLLTAEKDIPFSDMPDFYGEVSALIVTTDPEFGEGTPNPVLEALACGKPVISPAIGIVPQVLKDGVNGFIYDGSKEDLKEKIALLRETGPVNMSKASRTAVEPFSWVERVNLWREVFYALTVDPGALTES